MISIYSYLLTLSAILFWIFRVVVTLMFQLKIDFFVIPLNLNIEIMVLFATLPCLIFVVKRNIVGAAAYLAIYATYFGTALYENILGINESGLTIGGVSGLIFTILGILIPLLTFLDVLINKNRGLGKGSKKADWFFDNSDYDRKFDERADRNQYRL